VQAMQAGVFGGVLMPETERDGYTRFPDSDEIDKSIERKPARFRSRPKDETTLDIKEAR